MDSHRVRWHEAALAALLGAITLYLYARQQYGGLRVADDFEYASVARNIARGEGIVSQFLNPIELTWWDGVRHPAFFHAPGASCLMALSFLVLGVSDFAAVLPNMVGFVVLVALTFHLGATLWGRLAGWTGALLVALHPGLLQQSVVAMAEIPTALFFTVFVAFLCLQRGWIGAAAAGAALGASQWCRETFLLALPIAVVAVARLGEPERRRSRVVALVCGFGAVVAPLVVRSLVATGKPWFSIGTYGYQTFTPRYPHLNIYRTLEPTTFGEFLRTDALSFVKKFVPNLASAPDRLARTLGLALIIPFCAQLPLNAGRRFGTLRGVALVILAVSALAFAGFTMHPRYFLTFVPAFAVMAGAGAANLVEVARTARRPLLTAAAAALILVGSVAVWHFGREVTSEPPPNRWAGIQRFVAEHTRPGDVVATDAPEAPIWHADRNSIWLPLTTEMLEEIDRKIPVSHVLLTSVWCRGPYFKDPWGRILEGEASLPGYRTTARFDDGLVQAVLLARVSDAR